MLSRYYAPKPDSSSIESDRDIFAEKIGLIGLDGCEYIQKFVGSKIIKYYTIVAAGVGEAFINRVQSVSDKYTITPYSIRNKGNEYHAIYLLARPLSKKLADNASSALGSILLCDMQYWTFFQGFELDGENDNNTLRTEQIDLISKYFSDRSGYIGDSINDQLIEYANQVQASDIINKFGRKDDYDSDLNIIVGYGFPFQYVLSIQGSLESTLKFFNEHYSIGFKIQDIAINTYFVDGVVGKSNNLVEHLGGYAVEGEKGMVRITDFMICVHYKMLKHNSDTVFAISLISKTGKKTPIFEWSNSASESNLVELVQSQGNYHFITPTKKYLIQIHTMISSMEVPTIYSIPQFGRNVFMGNDVIVYMNGVFDISRKLFFPKSEDVNFYFLDGTDGFCIQDDRGNNIDDSTKGMVPAVKGNDIYMYDDYLDIFKKMYKDHTGEFLVMVCMTYMGYALFSEEDVMYNPIFCGYGVTGSGKTTFAEFIKMMLGIDGTPIVFGAGTTNFALLKMLGAINKFPVMCSEYRAGTTDGVGKEAIFRSLYDRKPIAKGNVTQTITSYKLQASMFLEGEELPTDGAVRSRFIHKRLAKRFRNVSQDIDLGYEIAKGRPMIDSFVNSYQIVADKETYVEALASGRLLIGGPGKEPRIVDNLSMMYASCMAFDKSKKDYYLAIIAKLSGELHEDLEDNGTGTQILKVIGMYLSGRWAKIYIDEPTGRLIIPWVDILSFIRRQRIELTLQVESYEDHLVEMGFESGIFEVQEEDGFGNKDELCVQGFAIHVLKAPKELLCRKETYSLYKKLGKK